MSSRIRRFPRIFSSLPPLFPRPFHKLSKGFIQTSYLPLKVTFSQSVQGVLFYFCYVERSVTYGVCCLLNQNQISQAKRPGFKNLKEALTRRKLVVRTKETSNESEKNCE